MALFDRLFGRTPEPAAPAALHAERDRDRLAAHRAAVALSFDPRIAGSTATSSHPVLVISDRLHGAGVGHETELAVMAAMRQFVPVLDAAINLRRALEGDVFVESKDTALADELNAFIETVPVGYLGGRAAPVGLNTYLDLLSESADEFGLSAGEIVLRGDGRAIERLVSPSSRTLFSEDRDRDGVYELYQNQRTGREVGRQVRLDDAPNVQILTFSTPRLRDGATPWPKPLAWALTRDGEALMRIVESIINGWFRFGDPTLLNTIEYEPGEDPAALTVPDGMGGTTEVPIDLSRFSAGSTAVYSARKSGKTGDVYVSVIGGKVRSEVLGNIDQTMTKYVREHTAPFEGHIIGAAMVPVWMFPSHLQTGDGLGSNRSEQQNLLCAVAAEKRTKRRNQLAQEILDLHLVVTGRARSIGRYEIKNDTLSITDDKVRAEALKMQAEAESQIIDNVTQLFDEEGKRRFGGEAEKHLIGQGLYPNP